MSVSPNGVLSRGQPCSTVHDSDTLPTYISPNALLFFFWDHLQDDGTGGFLAQAISGQAVGSFGRPAVGSAFNLYFRSRLFDTSGGSNPINGCRSTPRTDHGPARAVKRPRA